MQNHSPDRLEIFLALALKSGAKENVSVENAESAEIDFTPIYAYLSEKESERFKRLQTNFQNKSATEKSEWQTAILKKIGMDEPLIDDTIHWTYVNEALQKEISAVKKIIF